MLELWRVLFAKQMKKPLFLSKQRLSHLVANQGFEPRTCGL
ncbi:hypothetical protein BLA15945_00990 [Burkholderia lata]|uniref:Uncharacterized protein n=1 Tax=Burkholderia lata (strain ATCC 17760 / DSM 23089 / LMG 22485 / NCIMB 9086 / R18194 / 383) TaxID=482957 RepID=A0A6P2I3N4_BURL3|nr:hypothetical protein BLA15945_00990 [Burkholderia lata]